MAEVQLKWGCCEEDVGGDTCYTCAAVIPGGVQLVGVVFGRAHIYPLYQVDTGENKAIRRVFPQPTVTQFDKPIFLF